MAVGMTGAQILIAEDYNATREQIAGALSDAGFRVTEACDGIEALQLLETTPIDLVLSDHQMPRMDGLELYAEVRKRRDVPFILYSASASTEVSFRAGKKGISQFLNYPFEVDSQLMPTIHDTLRRASENRISTKHPSDSDMIGHSAQMEALREEIRRYARITANVLVTGETGTGKELIARALHRESPRAEKELVKVNCPALPSTLVESELFGHENGAFTGAAGRRSGRFEMADRGFIFLDEIGELELPVQAKLLQVLQEGTFERVGGTTTIQADVRVIAATNRDLPAEVAAGRFREDLYYRLAETTIHIDPLRDRPDDIEPLAFSFLQRFSSQHQRPTPDVTPEFVEAIRVHPWTGNVRELRAAMQRVIIWWDGSKPLDALCFLQAITSTNGNLSPSDRAFCQRMLQAYSRCRGNQEAARRELGLSRAEWRHRWEHKFDLQILGRKRR